MEISCECGYLANGPDDDALVADAQAHARDVHRVELTAELVVALARRGAREFAPPNSSSATTRASGT